MSIIGLVSEGIKMNRNELAQQVGERIAFLRTKLGLSQEALAALAETTQVTIARWERGHVLPNAETLIKIAKALECSVDYLLGLSDDPESFMPVSLDSSTYRVILLMKDNNWLEAAIFLMELARQSRNNNGIH